MTEATHTPRWKKILKAVIFIYLVILVLLQMGFYFFQDKLLFHPLPLAADHGFNFSVPFRETNIKMDAQTNYNIIQFYPADDTIPKGVVLYFHGNEKNIERYAQYAKRFTDNNYEIWMVDYPGFGKSTGKFNEDELYAFSLQFYKLARVHFSQQQIIIYGKSLGTGIATYLADKRDCKHLILETPYYNFRSVINDYTYIFPVGYSVRYKFPINEHITNVTAPITIFHGTDDEVIALRNAEKLKKFLKPGDEFIIIKGGKHNELTNDVIVQKKLDQILQ
jgi:alpha-beta hydrolase superfamily lysophospholipase